MKRTLLLLALAITLGLGAAAQDNTINDMVRRDFYAQANADITCPVDVVFMGNSITNGWPHTTQFFSNNPGLQGRGISGQTTCEMLLRFRQDVLALYPKVVVLLAGINDIARNNGNISIDDIYGNIISMVQLARYNGIKVALCSTLPCKRIPWRKEIESGPVVVQLNEMLRDYVNTQNDKNLIYVDYYTSLATPEGALRPELTRDGCHPKAEGYKIMEGIITKALSKWAKIKQ